MTARNGPRRGEAPVAAALAQGATYAEAAAAGRVSERTVKRWIAERPAFRRMVAELNAACLEEARRRITAAAPLAADYLIALATEPASAALLSPAVRLRAAQGLIDTAERGHAAGLVDTRLSEIEARLGLTKGAP